MRLRPEFAELQLIDMVALAGPPCLWSRGRENTRSETDLTSSWETSATLSSF